MAEHSSQSRMCHYCAPYSTQNQTLPVEHGGCARNIPSQCKWRPGLPNLAAVPLFPAMLQAATPQFTAWTLPELLPPSLAGFANKSHVSQG